MRRNAAMFDFRERRSGGRLKMLLVLVFGLAAGFAGAQWLSDEVARRAAENAATDARAELAAAVCADDFMQQPDARGALSKLVLLDWDGRAAALARGGWATMPDQGEPEKEVARLCAMRLGEHYTRVRKNIPLALP